MRKICYIILLFFTPYFSEFLSAQDIIYTKTGNINCKIKEITSEYIKYFQSEKQALISLPTNKSILLFNSEGKYLVPGKMDFNIQTTKNSVTDFLNPRESPLTNDIVYTLKSLKYSGKIEEENKTNVFIYRPGAAEKINTKDIAVIIYSTGKHRIVGPLQKSADVLYENRDKPVLPSAIKNNSDKSSESSALVIPAVKQSPENPQTKKATPKPVNTTPTFVSDEIIGSKATVPLNSVLPNQETATPPKNKFSELAPNTNFDQFQLKIEKKVYQLNDYLKIICNKNLEITEVYKATNSALELFVDDKARVQVSSLNSDIIHSYVIPEYLRRLRTFDYDRVEIEWTNISYVTKFRKGPDGKYTASITFQQVFRGFRDGKTVYEDMTDKKAEIKLKSTQKSKEGTDVEGWDVLLSDIGVKSTETLSNNKQ